MRNLPTVEVSDCQLNTTCGRRHTSVFRIQNETSCPSKVTRPSQDNDYFRYTYDVHLTTTSGMSDPMRELLSTLLKAPRGWYSRGNNIDTIRL